jgi:hypothetical protein
MQKTLNIPAVPKTQGSTGPTKYWEHSLSTLVFQSSFIRKSPSVEKWLCWSHFAQIWQRVWSHDQLMVLLDRRFRLNPMRFTRNRARSNIDLPIWEANVQPHITHESMKLISTCGVPTESCRYLEFDSGLIIEGTGLVVQLFHFDSLGGHLGVN